MYTINGIFSDLIEGIRAGVRRLKVEIGSVAFSRGLSFRAFNEFNLPTGESYTIKIISPINFNLTDLLINIESGGVRYESILLPTSESGFIDPIEVRPLNIRNDKTEQNTASVTAFGGGDIVGGVIADVALIKTGTNNQRTSIVDGGRTIRGLPPGTYYVRVTATSNSTIGVMYAGWDEI